LEPRFLFFVARKSQAAIIVLFYWPCQALPEYCLTLFF
jgi:hypothetical protein